ncbi:MAG: 3-oxoacyl-ACP synthase [Desulfobacteraceae bacterium]|nr:MAG: 3-oxoacyl-ACP synthase [Desulfobacteraceae bacterium]
MNTKSLTDWDKVRAMQDEEIDTSDIAPLDDHFFKNAKLRMPEGKTLITIRVDSDVLEWLKSQGKGYQTKINAILRTYMEEVQDR